VPLGQGGSLQWSPGLLPEAVTAWWCGGEGVGTVRSLSETDHPSAASATRSTVPVRKRQLCVGGSPARV